MNGGSNVIATESTWAALRRLLGYVGPVLSHVLPSTGRRFADLIPHLEADIAAVANRWMNTYPMILNGRASGDLVRQYQDDFLLLGEWVDRNLKGEERRAAIAAIFSRIPEGIRSDKAVKELAAALTRQLDTQQRLAVELSAWLRGKSADLARLEAAGTLDAKQKAFLDHVREFQRIVGEDFDACLDELSAELVWYLKMERAGARSVDSFINNIQGSVGQAAALRSQVYRKLIDEELQRLRRLVPEVMGPDWVVTEVRTGRIYTARIENGVKTAEYVDGAIIVHQKVADPGKLPKGFIVVGTEAKAVLDVSTLLAQMERGASRLPGLSDENMLLFLWEGQYRAIEHVAAPLSLNPKRYLIAAEGGKLPENLALPILDAEHRMLEPTISRELCRNLAWWLLRRAEEMLKGA